MKIAELEEHIERLHRLLKSPEPGLSSWHQIVAIEVETMIRKWYLSKPPMSIPKNRAPLSTENAREIVDALDELIKTRVEQMANGNFSAREEHCELIKRRITDYLLMTDPRGGVYQTGKDPR